MKLGSSIVALSLAAALAGAASCGPKSAATPAPAPAVKPAAPAATPPPAARATPPPAAPIPPPEPPPAVMPPPVKPIVSMTAPSPDPRVGLAPGKWNAAQAAWNLRLVSTTPPPEKMLDAWHSDLAFSGKYVVEGNFSGFEIWDVSNPAKPVLANSYLCPASQNDVSIYKNLLFMSSESTASRTDCGFGGIPEPVSKDRVRGIRIFSIADVKHPALVANVQTCRGSHTHTVLADPKDTANVYIYISGSAGVRSPDELPGCVNIASPDDPSTAQFRIEVIKVPLAAPQTASIVSSPRIFSGLAPAPKGDQPVDPRPPRAGGAGAGGAPPVPMGPSQCHDITVYPAVGLAGGACGGYGLLLDIHDPAHPTRIDFAGDPNMSFWHSATFNNDGSKVLFSDEWGGGTAPRCRVTDKMEYGADALFTIAGGKMSFKSYYKMPAPQTVFENCVAHNGSLIPIPGRDVMIQAWYQGGISMFDWTDISHPKEIAFFDRGPNDGARLVTGGFWSAYWYNGYIYGSEITRGLDVFEVLASGLISQNEIDAANTVKFEYLNVQGQQKMVWPPSFALARAYVDQLERSNGVAAASITTIRGALASAEKQSGAARKTALAQLAAQLNGEAAGSTDAAKVRLLAAAIGDLANAQR